jgi:hypothetical protein
LPFAGRKRWGSRKNPGELKGKKHLEVIRDFKK